MKGKNNQNEQLDKKSDVSSQKILQTRNSLNPPNN